VKIITTVINTDSEQQWDFQGLNAIIIITIITDALHKCVELRIGIILLLIIVCIHYAIVVTCG